MTGEPAWLQWVRALQAVAQAGLAFTADGYDRERYESIRHIAAEIAAAQTSGDAQTIEGLFARASGYPTPKIDVRAAVIVEERILLVREGDDGRWTLPGGWADLGDSPAEAAVRETREEAGLDVEAVKLFALYDRQRRGHPPHPDYSYKAFFLCRPRESSAEPRPATQETTAAAFFAREELPPLSVMRITHQQIERAFAHHAQPSLPTEFD